jgi:hypothetical protein
MTASSRTTGAPQCRALGRCGLGEGVTASWWVALAAEDVSARLVSGGGGWPERWGRRRTRALGVAAEDA